MYASDLAHEFYAHFRRLIRRSYWSSFLAIINDDYHLRPSSLQIQLASGNTIQRCQNGTLLALRYYPQGQISGNSGTLALTLQHRRDVYTHRILNPSQIEAFYEPHGQIFAIAITSQSKERALLYFNDTEVAPQPAKVPIRTYPTCTVGLTAAKTTVDAEPIALSAK